MLLFVPRKKQNCSDPDSMAHAGEFSSLRSAGPRRVQYLMATRAYQNIVPLVGLAHYFFPGVLTDSVIPYSPLKVLYTPYTPLPCSSYFCDPSHRYAPASAQLQLLHVVACLLQRPELMAWT
jgi:hypothetical protein